MKIHPTAIVSPKAKLYEDIDIGPFSIIEDNAIIGKSCKIGISCVIQGHVTIGDNCRIFTGAVIGSAPQDLKYKGEESSVEIGNNNIIREYVTINRGTSEGGGVTRIGNNNLIMAYSHITHDCIVNNDCIIANCGTLAGHVTIEDKAVVGGLVAIHQFVKVGSLSIIGGCSKVVQDIPPYSTCDGHPTKVFGLNLLGLRRAKIPKENIDYLKHAFRLLFREGLTISHALESIDKEIPITRELEHLIDFIRHSKRGICR
jgi:UDP-N-acetylglucosamine acyltransferase